MKVTATSIKVLHEMNFDTMPAIGINAVLIGVTTQTVRNENDYSVLDFNIDKYLVTNLEILPFKFVLNLEDISLIYNNNYNNQTNNNQTINAPWLNLRQPNCVARGASPRTTRSLTNTLTTALNFNPLSNMNVLNSQQEQPEQSEQSKPNKNNQKNQNNQNTK
ncbi:hypothetical protein Glove_112g37 [Diversispora epigaea]|uniref:Uncharacterized protein n=1 Tax=Diversispora epigaea TaxID=1348612 RepID=A0A397J211_9GLOM|nr:hypothetical protein Glove_112g37 [Diversispora epigaea]